MMLAGKLIEGQRFFDRFLDPSDEPGIAGRPFGDPCGEVLAGLLDQAAVVKPAQFLQAVVVGLAWQMIQGVTQKVDVAALERGFGEDLADS